MILGIHCAISEPNLTTGRTTQISCQGRVFLPWCSDTLAIRLEGCVFRSVQRFSLSVFSFSPFGQVLAEDVLACRARSSIRYLRFLLAYGLVQQFGPRFSSRRLSKRLLRP